MQVRPEHGSIGHHPSSLLPAHLAPLRAGSIVVTSNQSLGAWGDVFGDRVISSAILDRLLHHATTVNIKGEPYRLKVKRCAGLFRPATSPETAQ